MLKIAKLFLIPLIVFSFVACGGGGGGGEQPQNRSLKANATLNISDDKVVTLDASKSDGNITKYQWYEGSELLGEEKILTKNDFSDGKHDITLVVTDDTGATDSTSISVNINEDTSTTVTTDETDKGNNNSGDGYNLRNMSLMSKSFTRDWTNVSYNSNSNSTNTGRMEVENKIVGKEIIYDNISTTKVDIIQDGTHIIYNYIDEGGIMISAGYGAKKGTVYYIDLDKPYDPLPTNAHVGDNGVYPVRYAKAVDYSDNVIIKMERNWELIEENGKVYLKLSEKLYRYNPLTSALMSTSSSVEKKEISKDGKIKSSTSTSTTYDLDGSITSKSTDKKYNFKY